MEVYRVVRSPRICGEVVARKLQLLIIITELLKLIELVVAEFARGKKEAALEDAQALGYRYRVEILDLEAPDFPGRIAVVVLHHVERDLEEIPVVSLKQEEESARAAFEFVHDP